MKLLHSRPMNEAEWQTWKQRVDTRLRAIQLPWTVRSSYA